MSEETKNTCHICSNHIDLKNPHFILTFNKEAEEEGEKKVLHSEKGALICEECGGAGLNSVLWNLKLIHVSDTELKEKMKKVVDAVDIVALMKDFGISGEQMDSSNQYLAKCPFHEQEKSFIFDTYKKEYFCLCEGMQGDVFSFVINYDRDVKNKHMTLKQAVDFLMETYDIP
jgi:hypothetical protein